MRVPFGPIIFVSTSMPPKLMHMKLCGRIKLGSPYGSKNVFVIGNNYSKFTFFLKDKINSSKYFPSIVGWCQTLKDFQSK